MAPDLQDIDGVGAAMEKRLRDAGFDSLTDVASADTAALRAVHGLGEKTAAEMISQAGKLLGTPVEDAAKAPVIPGGPRSMLARIKGLFTRHSKLDKELKKMEELTEKELAQQELRKRLFSDQGGPKKKKSSGRIHRSLQQLLIKAGIGMSATAFKKLVFYASIGLSMLLTVIVLITGSMNATSWQNLAIFLAGFWTAGFALIVILLCLVAAAVIDIRIVQRRKQLEEVLPDYLQLVAANIGAGMTVDRALWFAVRPRFGVLAKEIEDVAKRVITGEELPDALRRFSQQYDSPVLQRSVNLLLEGIAAGGKIADLLHKISNDISEQRILRQEMAANVMTYVIFISFAAVIAAPILFGLSTQLLVVIQDIAGNIGTSGSSSVGISVSPDVISLSDFRIFSMTLLSFTAIMSAFIISVIRKGEAFDGLRFVPVFVFVSLTLYFLSVAFFGSLFGGLV